MSWINVKVNDDVDEHPWSGWVTFHDGTLRIDGVDILNDPDELRELLSDLAGVAVALGVVK